MKTLLLTLVLAGCSTQDLGTKCQFTGEDNSVTTGSCSLSTNGEQVSLIFHAEMGDVQIHLSGPDGLYRLSSDPRAVQASQVAILDYTSAQGPLNGHVTWKSGENWTAQIVATNSQTRLVGTIHPSP